jgi:AAA ATPase domain
MVQPQSSGDGKERGIFAVTQQYPGSSNPARRFASRPCNRHQLRHILIADRQLNHPPPCRHDLRPLPRIKGQGTGQRNRSESHANDQFYGIDELGASAIESRFEAMRTAMTPLVGRDEEIDPLLRRWEQAKGGDGQMVLISGEPGIGKSRIAETLLERLSNEPHIRSRRSAPMTASGESGRVLARQSFHCRSSRPSP